MNLSLTHASIEVNIGRSSLEVINKQHTSDDSIITSDFNQVY